MAIILSIVGFIVGIISYGTSDAETGTLLLPILYTIGGAMIGGLLDVIVNAIKGDANKPYVKILFLLLTLACLGFTGYALFANREFFFANSGLSDLAEGNIVYGLLNFILSPFVMIIRYFAGDQVPLAIVASVFVAFGYSIILSIIFVNSSMKSTAAEHEGKVLVTYDGDTGAEIDRKNLDADHEAWKANALAVLIIILASIVFPFAAFAFGIYLLLNKLFEKWSGWVAFFYFLLFVVAPYVVIAILCK